MNANEALKALLEGKKVTCEHWDDHHFIYLSEDGKFRGEADEIYEWDEWTHQDGWSIFGEPKTYTRAEALKLLAEGKKISNVLWRDMYLYTSPDGNIIVAGVCSPDEYNWNALNETDGFIVKE